MGSGKSRASSDSISADAGSYITATDEFYIHSSNGAKEQHRGRRSVATPWSLNPFPLRSTTLIESAHRSAAKATLKQVCASLANSSTDAGVTDASSWMRICRLMMLLGLDRTILPHDGGDSSSSDPSDDDENEGEGSGVDEELLAGKSILRIRRAMEGPGVSLDDDDPGSKRLRERRDELKKAAQPEFRGTMIQLLDCARIAVLRTHGQDGYTWDCLGEVLWYLERRSVVHALRGAPVDAYVDTETALGAAAQWECRIYEDVYTAKQCFEKAWEERGVRSSESSHVLLDAMELLFAVASTSSERQRLQQQQQPSGRTNPLAVSVTSPLAASGAAAAASAASIRGTTSFRCRRWGLEDITSISQRLIESLERRWNQAPLWYALSRIIYIQERLMHQQQQTQSKSASAPQTTTTTEETTNRKQQQQQSFLVKIRCPNRESSEVSVGWLEALCMAIDCDPRDVMLWFAVATHLWPNVATDPFLDVARLERDDATHLSQQVSRAPGAETTSNKRSDRALPRHILDGGELSILSDNPNGDAQAGNAERCSPQQHLLYMNEDSNPSTPWAASRPPPPPEVEEDDATTVRSESSQANNHSSSSFLTTTITIGADRDMTLGMLLTSALHYCRAHAFDEVLEITTFSKLRGGWHGSLLTSKAKKEYVQRQVLGGIGAQVEATMLRRADAMCSSIVFFADLLMLVSSHRAESSSPKKTSVWLQQQFCTTLPATAAPWLVASSTTTPPRLSRLVGESESDEFPEEELFVTAILEHWPSRPSLWRYLAALLARRDAVQYAEYWRHVAQTVVVTSHALPVTSQQPPRHRVQRTVLAARASHVDKDGTRQEVRTNQPLQNDSKNFFWTPATATIRGVKYDATACQFTSLTMNPNNDPISWFNAAQLLRRYDVDPPTSTSLEQHGQHHQRDQQVPVAGSGATSDDWCNVLRCTAQTTLAPPRTVATDAFGEVTERLCLEMCIASVVRTWSPQPVSSSETLPYATDGNHPLGPRTFIAIASHMRLCELECCHRTSPHWETLALHHVKTAIQHVHILQQPPTNDLRMVVALLRCIELGLFYLKKSCRSQQNSNDVSLDDIIASIRHVRPVVNDIMDLLFGEEGNNTNVSGPSTVAMRNPIALTAHRCIQTLVQLFAQDGSHERDESSSRDVLEVERSLLLVQLETLTTQIRDTFTNSATTGEEVGSSGSSRPNDEMRSVDEFLLQSAVNNVLPALDTLVGQIVRGDRTSVRWRETLTDNFRKRWLTSLLDTLFATTWRKVDGHESSIVLVGKSSSSKAATLIQYTPFEECSKLPHCHTIAAQVLLAMFFLYVDVASEEHFDGLTLVGVLMDMDTRNALWAEFVDVTTTATTTQHVTSHATAQSLLCLMHHPAFRVKHENVASIGFSHLNGIAVYIRSAAHILCDIVSQPLVLPRLHHLYDLIPCCNFEDRNNPLVHALWVMVTTSLVAYVGRFEPDQPLPQTSSLPPITRWPREALLVVAYVSSQRGYQDVAQRCVDELSSRAVAANGGGVSVGDNTQRRSSPTPEESPDWQRRTPPLQIAVASGLPTRGKPLSESSSQLPRRRDRWTVEAKICSLMCQALSTLSTSIVHCLRTPENTQPREILDILRGYNDELVACEPDGNSRQQVLQSWFRVMSKALYLMESDLLPLQESAETPTPTSVKKDDSTSKLFFDMCITLNSMEECNATAFRSLQADSLAVAGWYISHLGDERSLQQTASLFQLRVAHSKRFRLVRDDVFLQAAMDMASFDDNNILSVSPMLLWAMLAAIERRQQQQQQHRDNSNNNTSSSTIIPTSSGPFTTRRLLLLAFHRAPQLQNAGFGRRAWHRDAMAAVEMCPTSETAQQQMVHYGSVYPAPPSERNGLFLVCTAHATKTSIKSALSAL